MKIRILKDFLREQRIAGVRVNTLKTLLQKNQDQIGPVIIDGTKPLGCVRMHYQLKKKTTNCFMVQKEVGIKNVPHNACYQCHLRFLELYEQDKIKLKK